VEHVQGFIDQCDNKPTEVCSLVDITDKDISMLDLQSKMDIYYKIESKRYAKSAVGNPRRRRIEREQRGGADSEEDEAD